MERQYPILIILVGLITTTACVGGDGSQQKGETMEVTAQELVKPCGTKPNCVSSAVFDSPENEQPDWSIAPLGYDHRAVEGKKAFEKLVDILKAENMTLEINYPRINAVATTKVFNYKDDLTFIVVADEGIIHIRSESRKGHYDFGKNRRRLEAIRNSFVVNP